MVSDQYRLVLCRRRVVADVVSVEASQCQRGVQRHVRYRQTRLFRRHVHEQLRQQTPTRELSESANLRQDQISRGIVFSRGDKLKLVHCPCTRGLPSTISSLKITDRSFRYASPRLCNQLPDSFRQPHQCCLDSPPHPLVNVFLSSSPLSSFITHSLFHSRLKTYLFNKSFPA